MEAIQIDINSKMVTILSKTLCFYLGLLFVLSGIVVIVIGIRLIQVSL